MLSELIFEPDMLTPQAQLKVQAIERLIGLLEIGGLAPPSRDPPLVPATLLSNGSGSGP